MAVAELDLGEFGLRSCGGTNRSAVVGLLWCPTRKQLNGLQHPCFAVVKRSSVPCAGTGGCLGRFGGRLCSVDGQRPNEDRRHTEAGGAIVDEPP